MEDRTEPSSETVDAERVAAHQDHAVDRLATEAESAAADQWRRHQDAGRRREVADHEREMGDLGAQAEGEGAIE